MKTRFNSSSVKMGTVRRQDPHWPAGLELKLRRILVPLDFSGQSRQALEYAVPLALKFGAKISLLHVIQPPAVVRTLPDGGITIPTDIARLVRPARERLADMASEFLPAEVRGRNVVSEGSPVYEIITAAKKLETDMIILSTHGFTGLKRVLLGSTAERVVRHAHCPVLTVRRRAGTPARPANARNLPWKQILVPLDFSLTSLRALEVAVPLAREAGAGLSLLHVIEPENYAAGMVDVVLLLPESTQTSNAETNLAQVAQRFVPAPLRKAARVERGRAASVIVETAAAEKVDLIVLSTHGHTGWERLLMGSTTEHVVRHAGCPVLVVRKLRGLRSAAKLSQKQTSKTERISHGNELRRN